MPQVMFNLRHDSMEETEDEPIDDILNMVRAAIIDNERKRQAEKFSTAVRLLHKEKDVFELSKAMLVKREDIPYQLGIWNFDDVAKKMLKKYRMYFMTRNLSAQSVRVQVKEEPNLLKISSSF